jgi:hypothetical protein
MPDSALVWCNIDQTAQSRRILIDWVDVRPRIPEHRAKRHMLTVNLKGAIKEWILCLD